VDTNGITAEGDHPMGASRTKIGIAVALAITATLASLLVWTGPTDAPQARPPGASTSGHTSLLRPGDVQAEGTRTEPAVAGAATGSVGQGAVQPDPAVALVQAREELRAALEASLCDSLDPVAILDAALALGRLEVDPRAFSEPDPSGCTVYPLLGAPEGTRAELWVGRSSKPQVQRVLSLRLELDAQASPYMLEGCSRSKAIAQLQMQLDHAGRPLNLSILTDFPPSRQNRDLGIPLEQGEIPQGVLWCLDTDEPDRWRARKHGLDQGLPGSWEEPALLLAGRWPSPDKLAAFGSLLQRQFESVRH
jgi:hypothetical protein